MSTDDIDIFNLYNLPGSSKKAWKKEPEKKKRNPTDILIRETKAVSYNAVDRSIDKALGLKVRKKYKYKPYVFGKYMPYHQA